MITSPSRLRPTLTWSFRFAWRTSSPVSWLMRWNGETSTGAARPPLPSTWPVPAWPTIAPALSAFWNALASSCIFFGFGSAEAQRMRKKPNISVTKSA